MSLVKIYFDAYKKTGFSSVNSVIPYDDIAVNLGNGLDVKSGIFTAPVDGDYLLMFTALKNVESTYLRFLMKKNATTTVAATYAYSENKVATPMKMSSIQSLKKGETISVVLSTGSSSDFDNEFHTQFIGIKL